MALAGLGVVQLVSPGIDRSQTFAGADPFGPLVEGPTRGDLAGDAGYAAAVLAAWEQSHDDSQNKRRGIFDDLRGEPWVAWAGSTPAGPAALVAQQAFLHEHSDIQLESEGITTLLGFVGPDERGRPQVVGDSYPAPGVPLTTAWFVDEARTVVAALAEPSAIGISTSWAYAADGTVSSSFVVMDDRDGARVHGLPDGSDPSGVRVAAVRGAAFDDVRLVVNPTDELPGGFPDVRLPWSASNEGEPLDVLELDESGSCASVGWDQMRLAWAPVEASAPVGYVVAASSLWFGCGRLEDGRQVLVGERRIDADPSRAIVLLRQGERHQLVDGGPIDPAAVLPVRVELPGSQGWVVADRGATLRHRSGAGAWSEPRADAALLPATATQVEVTRPGRAPVVVDLVSRR